MTQPTETLITAVIANNTTQVQQLLLQGVDPNACLDAALVTPLHYAAQNNALSVIPLLIEAGAEIQAQTQSDGTTPLSIAVLHGHDKVVQLLMAYLNHTDGKIN